MDLQQFTAQQGAIKSNTKIKTYPDGSASVLVCSQPIFGGDGWELRTDPSSAEKAPKESTVYDDIKNLKRAKQRAKSNLKDLILCNDFRYFITLTLSPDKIERSDYQQIIKKLNVFLNNAVQRKGLQYIIVPEFHKDNKNIHFHGLINSALNLTDSGTVTVEGHKKPIKTTTYSRYYKGKPAHIVYNIPQWTLGYTTAIEVYGDKMAVARYIGKYLEKDFTKVGGRYYLHSSNLQLPVVTYAESDFNVAQGQEFTIDGVNARFKYTFISPEPSGSAQQP